MSERELMILERRIKRNLKRSPKKLCHEVQPAGSSQFRDDSNYTESFVDGGELSGAGGGSVISPMFPMANIDGDRNAIRKSRSSVCAGYHHHQCRLIPCPPSVAWWKSRKSSSSMIVSVPVRRLKKSRKKKCTACKKKAFTGGTYSLVAFSLQKFLSIFNSLNIYLGYYSIHVVR